MNTASFAAHALFVSVVIACAAPSNDHPARRCGGGGECPDSLTCHAGFCIEPQLGKQVVMDDFGAHSTSVDPATGADDASTGDNGNSDHDGAPSSPGVLKDAGAPGGDGDDDGDGDEPGDGDEQNPQTDASVDAPGHEPDAGDVSEGPIGCPLGVCCGLGFTLCEGECVDLLSAVTHCGDCDQACKPGLLCMGGTCCKADQILCDGKCVDPDKDKHNCGACGQACDKGPCKDGECRRTP